MTSFLICFHDDRSDVYENGLPLGIVRAGKFEAHHHTMPDGQKIPVTIRQELLGCVLETISQMESKDAK